MTLQNYTPVEMTSGAKKIVVMGKHKRKEK